MPIFRLVQAMPLSKNRKQTDKDILWAWCHDTDVDKIGQPHLEYVYRLKQHIPNVTLTKNYTSRETSESTNENAVVSEVESINSASSNQSGDDASSNLEKIDHSRCRKNCGSLFCLSSLGFEKWSSGDMDYDYPSDDEDEPATKRKQDMPVGLLNLGATCYVNAFLQLWYHTLAFRNAVFEWNTDSESAFPICESLQYIFGLLELSERRCVDPSSLITSLGLDASQQQDAQEFSKLFIDLLPCQRIKDLFSGSYSYVTKCSGCHNETRNPSQFNELDLSIEGFNTLEEALASFLKAEKLTGDNQYFCSNCQSKQNATRRIKLENLPAVLNMQLLRFVFDRKTGHKKKLTTCLQFPDVLDFSDMMQSSESPSVSADELQYELMAVLMHSGVTAFSGHYTAHIRIKDHWYSFNDANVSKLKGKRLNLATEESLDYDPVVTSMNGEGSNTNTENRRKGNRSKNAYMLVYQQRKFIQNSKDLLPSPAPDHVKDKVTLDNQTMHVKSQETEIQQTEELMRVEMKKDMVLDMWKDLTVNDRDTEDYYFIPQVWFSHILKDWNDIVPLETQHLLCKHGKLNWQAANKVKAVSQSQGKLLYEKFGRDVRPLTRFHSLCLDCIRNQCIYKKTKAKVDDDNRTLSALLSSTANQDSLESAEPDDCLSYWVSKPDMKRWRSLVLKSLELAAATVSESAVRKDRVFTDNLSEAYENSHCDARQQEYHSNETSSSKFNDSLLCAHGNLDPSMKYRQLVPAAVWSILSDYFPSATTFTQHEPACIQCTGVSEQLEKMEEQRKHIVKEHKQLLSDLASMKNRPILDALNTDVVYGLSVDSYKQWKSFLRNPTSSGSIQSIENRSLICPHDKLYILPENSDSIVWLWSYEWEVLTAGFPSDTTIMIQKKTAPTSDDGSVVLEAAQSSTELRLIPDICEGCLQSRQQALVLESHTFSSAKIYIRQIEADEKPLSQQTDQSALSTDQLDQSVLSTNTQLANGSNEDNDSSQDGKPEAKKMKIDLSSLAHDGEIRRSNRKKFVRGDKSVRMSSTNTLQELRIEITKLFAIAPFDQRLTLDGQRLEGNDKTLAELLLYPNCTIQLQGETYDEGYTEQIMLQQGIIEEGFRGTGLLAQQSTI